jgi:hypothetical protein
MSKDQRRPMQTPAPARYAPGAEQVEKTADGKGELREDGPAPPLEQQGPESRYATEQMRKYVIGPSGRRRAIDGSK